MTTHVCLVARALGASEAVVCGEAARGVLDSVELISKRWGGKFGIRYEPAWKKAVKRAPGEALVHLTMYGERVQDRMQDIRKEEKVVVVVGAEKVPSELYSMADYNIAVTNQPHSEVAALAIFLDKYFEGRELDAEFKDAEIRVVPNAKGKRVEERHIKKLRDNRIGDKGLTYEEKEIEGKGREGTESPSKTSHLQEITF